MDFQVGEWVFLKLRPHRQTSLTQRSYSKLSPRFYGPFQILDRIGKVAYKLQLPPTSKVHPVFHVSLLKKVMGKYPIEVSLPNELAIDDIIYPEKVMSTRVRWHKQQQITEHLIQWQGLTAEEAT